MPAVPVVVLASVDPVLRDAAAAGILCDAHGALVVRYDLAVESGMIRRIVYGPAGVREDTALPLGRCGSCSVSADALRTVDRLVMARAQAVVVSLPATADPVPVACALQSSGGEGHALAAVLSLVDGRVLDEDLLGDDLLVERGLATTDDDRRSVGEALARQIESADLVCALDGYSERTSALLDHLVRGEVERVPLHAVDALALLERRRVPADSRRGGLGAAAPTGAPPRSDVWTVDLRSWRPLHPERLLDQVLELGAGPMRGRGYFWLHTRPHTMCAWDGVGGQLSIDALGSWHRPRETRLVVTGTDRDPGELTSAFQVALMTDAELVRGPRQDADTDGWDDWLGPREEAASHQHRRPGFKGAECPPHTISRTGEL